VEAPKAKTSTEKPVVKERFRKKVVADERGWLLSRQRPVQERKRKEAVVSEESSSKAERPCRGSDYYSVSKIGN
jgi:hypothetical protein